jgi:hypothetical protein
MIKKDSTYYVRGKFTGIALGQEIGKIDSKKIRSINFLPNCTIKSAESISEYNQIELGSKENSIITPMIRGVNILPIDIMQLPSKEIITNVVIEVEAMNVFTDFKHELFTQIDGTIYCKIDTTQEGAGITMIEKEPNIQFVKEKIEDKTAILDNIKSKDYSALTSKGRGCISNLLRILLLILLLFWLLSFLRTCNSLSKSNETAIPTPIQDTIFIRDTNFILQPMITINDWNIEDGDMVDIFMNEISVVENCKIKATPQTFILNALHIGENILRIKAKNYGKGSLTAFVEISDGQFVERHKVQIEPGDLDYTKTIYVHE